MLVALAMLALAAASNAVGAASVWVNMPWCNMVDRYVHCDMLQPKLRCGLWAKGYASQAECSVGCYDLDRDGDVDHHDLFLFQRLIRLQCEYEESNE